MQSAETPHGGLAEDSQTAPAAGTLPAAAHWIVALGPGLGLVPILLTHRKQAQHDLVAKTCVQLPKAL